MGIRYTEERSYKFQLVLDELINLKANVVFVQETHIGPQSYEVLESIQGWRSFFTVHHPRSKGVAILIKNETIFRHICHDEDYSGGYIVLFCRLYGQLFTLVNVYNHRADRRMLDRLRNYLTAINTKGVLVVGGDFNTVLDPTFD
uniref:Endonuclease/exonuclease/phosphatase domain-containing protein n=1 Tax=Sinocyclocheilus rhinocerous TaxID=307959 RepID=A0A673GDV7_9TELE